MYSEDTGVIFQDEHYSAGLAMLYQASKKHDEWQKA